MTNLEQVRARHALEQAAKLDRDNVQKLPALIINNGLLAATAFTLDAAAREGMKRVMDAVALHLAARGLIAEKKTSARGIIEDLTAQGRDPQALWRATAEALAFLGYVKRFARTGDGSGNQVVAPGLGQGDAQTQAPKG
jgi:CRISPR/Cas system CMR-associated protein Cmr5 small subunit